jgi:hypothetical protein
MKQIKKKSEASKKPKSGRKQASKTPQSGFAKTLSEPSALDRPEYHPAVRFSATIHIRDQADPDWMEKLDIDRVPDPSGVIRALVTPEDCVRLVNQGFEVRLHNAYPIEPLDPALIQTDDSVKRWFDAKVQSIKGAKRQKG